MMIAHFKKALSENIDHLAISYLYLEQRPRLKQALPPALLPPSKGEILRMSHPASFFCRGEINGSFSLWLYAERANFKVLRFSFPSHRTSPYVENNQVKGRIFLHYNRSAPCVLFLHGWRMRSYLSFSYLLRAYLQEGYHAAFMELPFHYSRKPAGTFSGEKMIEPDIGETLKNIRQAVCDARDTLAYLSCFPSVTQVALVGVSLGGWITALCCLAEKNIGSAVLISPPADPVAMFYRSEVIKVLKKGIENIDDYFEKNKKLLGFCCASSFTPLIEPRKILLVEAKYDRFVPREIVERLWKAWDKPPIVRYPHGHISIMLDTCVTRDILRHLNTTLAPSA